VVVFESGAQPLIGLFGAERGGACSQALVGVEFSCVVQMALLVNVAASSLSCCALGSGCALGVEGAEEEASDDCEEAVCGAALAFACEAGEWCAGYGWLFGSVGCAIAASSAVAAELFLAVLPADVRVGVALGAGAGVEVGGGEV
jgi:hypothetical protein